MSQTTNTVLMVEPSAFGYNQEAAETNKFQKQLSAFTTLEVQDMAMLEFQNAVSLLRNAGIEVVVFPDEAPSPDAVFPNNWFSTHAESLMVTYPMALPNRRAERSNSIIRNLKDTYKYQRHIQLEEHETQASPLFLEGTGSMILDRINRIAYAARSPRTNPQVLERFCQAMDYKAVLFNAYGPGREDIYHTNVMMCVGESFAAVALEVVAEQDRKYLKDSLLATGKEVIELSKEQTHFYFAGNMLQLHNTKNEKVLALSLTAFRSLTEKQLEQFHAHNQHILPLPIHVIEKCGGGSVRCMLAEIFKP